MENPYERTKQQLDLIPMLKQQVYRLRLIISDLAEVSRIEKDASEKFELVSVEDIVNEFKEVNQERIVPTQAVIQTTLLANDIYFSGRNLRSIVFNLLDNAIKYRKPDDTPTLELTTNYQDDYWVMSLRDNGIGIKKSALPKVFDMFKRFNRSTEGTGVGLYIIKRVTEKHDGAAWVESQLGEGSTYIIKILASVVRKKTTNA